MANGHIEIHDPLPNGSDLKSSTDCEPAPDTDSNLEDSPEFRLLMAYATRRRPESGQESGPVLPNGKPSPAPTPDEAGTEEAGEKEVKEEKRKKRGWKRLSKIFRCIQPQTKDEVRRPRKMSDDVSDRCGSVSEDEVTEKVELGNVADQLIKIASKIPFDRPNIESDAPEDENVERVIGLLLRDAGDRMNEQELKEALARELFSNYSFFQRMMDALLGRMGYRSPNSDSPGPDGSQKKQIAVACEATRRLSTMDTQPMNRLLGYGARYLSENYSLWVKQHGGYDSVFESDDGKSDDEKDDDEDVQ